VYRWTRSLGQTQESVANVRRYSRLGEHAAGWLVLGAVGGVVDRRRRADWWRAAGAVGLSYITSSSIKWAVGRKRPAVEDLPHLMATPTGLSFPSSHASSSFAAVRAYGCLLPRTPLLAAAVAMAGSRVYLGVHYPSDVLAGAGLGTALGRLAES
jgi:membrane-associated phospholipid phosphatase